MPDLPLGDITLHYEIEGSGPPLLLHAGMLSDSASWGPLVPLLSGHFTVIRPDNRSTGRTIPVDAANSAALMARDVLRLMDHLGHARFAIAGHSMGGLMAMELAGLAPERVARACVLASGRVRMPRTVAVFDALMAIRRAPKGEEMWLRALYPWIFGQHFFENPQNVEMAVEASMAYPFAQTPEGMARQIEMFRAFRGTTQPGDIACPVLVLYAGQDLLVPPALAKPGFQAIADLTEITIEDAGHSIVWDAPTEVAQHLLAFLQA